MQKFKNEFWTATAGDLTQRRDHLATPAYRDAAADAKKIIIDPTDQHQDWLGAGAAITDSAAYLIWDVMDAAQRDKLLHELFDPEQGGFSSVRVPLGSCDF